MIVNLILKKTLGLQIKKKLTINYIIYMPIEIDNIHPANKLMFIFN